jgi:hypothetical protein
MDAVIHGRFGLPPGCKLTIVPWDAEFDDDHAYQSWNWDDHSYQLWSWWERTTKGFRHIHEPPIDVACNYNLIKSLVSIFQVMFSAVTLYRTKGNEIERYGYAAFGLTVTPYAWMSLINLLGNLVRPSYPALYLVGSPFLDEICAEHGLHRVSGVVGRLKESSAERIQEQLSRGFMSDEMALDASLVEMKQRLLSFFRKATIDQKEQDKREQGTGDIFAATVILLGLSVPLIVFGVLSRFSNGGSTHAQRVWMMCWFAFGSVANIFGYLTNFNTYTGLPREPSNVLEPVSVTDGMVLIMMFMYVAPAIGGFVVVSEMIYEHGICTRLII